MNEIKLDIDEAGQSLTFDEENRTIYFNYRLPESVLASYVGDPLSRLVGCGGAYAEFATSTILSATCDDDWVEIRFS